MINSFDARDRAPESIKNVYKRYQKLTLEAIESDPTILDFRWGLNGEQQGRVRKVRSVPLRSIAAACFHLGLTESHTGVASREEMPVYETEAVPGKPRTFHH